MARKRRHVEEQVPLGPDDDPYLAYLIWREQRDAAQADGEPGDDSALAAAAEPTRRSWIRRLARWKRNDESAP
ncbi:MAG TPA: hypothetical protein VKA62_06555 [Agromyces sp.]|nr:hypothetical protein [Agromyces sp.]